MADGGDADAAAIEDELDADARAMEDTGEDAEARLPRVVRPHQHRGYE